MGLAEKYPVRYRVEDYERWQGDWELVEGVPYAMASPSPVNQVLLTKLAVVLSQALERAGCENCFVAVELDWYVSVDTVIRPDLLVFCGEIPQKLTQRPHMVVEIVSPSTKTIDEGLKFELCQREGVPYFVLLYPEEGKVLVYELCGGAYRQKEDKSFRFLNCIVDVDFESTFGGLKYAD